MKFHPDVLAAHAEFGGDLSAMQALYDRPDCVARIAELEAKNERLASERDYWQSQHDERTRQLGQVADETLSRTGAVKVPAEASKEMIEDGVLAYNLTGIAGGIINTAEDHVTFIWNAMAAHLSALEPAAPEGQQPVAKAVELSGNTGELIEKMAEAIRGDTTSDDTPWATLSEDRKVGWRGDAERALAVVKEYLTVHRPSEQAVTDEMVEAAREIIHGARHVYSDIDLARAALKAAMEAGG